jgi:hypothetical protein
MDEAVLELVRNLPAAAAVMFTVYIMLYFEERREKRREENAKSKSQEDRDHEVTIAQMLHNNILTITNSHKETAQLILDRTNETFMGIKDDLEDHERSSKERYDRMQITQDLVRLAKEQAERRAR